MIHSGLRVPGVPECTGWPVVAHPLVIGSHVEGGPGIADELVHEVSRSAVEEGGKVLGEGLTFQVYPGREGRGGRQ